MVLSRNGGERGNHRYPVGFSGDTFQSFVTLDFEVRATQWAAAEAMTWSHDIGEGKRRELMGVVLCDRAIWQTCPSVYCGTLRPRHLADMSLCILCSRFLNNYRRWVSHRQGLSR